jgi:hypothetical protein
MYETVKECSSCDDNRARGNHSTIAQLDSRTAATTFGTERWVFQQQIRYFCLLDLEVRLRLEHLTHLEAVGLLVALSPRGPYRRSARGVQKAELNTDGISDFAHDPAQGVYFTNKMPFRDSPDRRVTRHLGDQVDVQSEQGSPQAHAGGSHRGFAASVTCSDYDNVVLFRERPHMFILTNTGGLRRMDAL